MTDVPDGVDEFDVYADEFEQLGRAAGAALRQPAPERGDADVQRSGARRRMLVRGGSAAAVVLVVVAGAALLTRPENSDLPSATVPPVGTDPWWIAYEAPSGRRQELSLVRSDGTGEHALVPELDGGNQSKSDWSPDGRTLVFTMAEGGGEALWTVGIDGSDPTRLLDCAGTCIALDDPSWSPDGRTVVYARLTHDGKSAVGTLERVDVATGETEVVLEADPIDFFAGPRWSPDGRSLVVEVVHRNGTAFDSEIAGVTLSVIELGAGEPDVRALTDPAMMAVTADWSPAGDLIVFAAPPDSPTLGNDLFTISPTGGDPVRVTFLTDDGGEASFPSFTPDGERVLFSASDQPGAAPVLAFVGIDGANLTMTVDGQTIEGSHPRP